MPWALLDQALLNPNPDGDLAMLRHPEQTGRKNSPLGLVHAGAGRRMVFLRVQL